MLLKHPQLESPLLKVAVDIIERNAQRLLAFTSFDDALSFLKYELPGELLACCATPHDWLPGT